MANEAKASFVSTTTYMPPDDIQLVYQQPVVLKMPAEYKVVDGEEVAVYPNVVVTLEPILPDTFLVPMSENIGVQSEGEPQGRGSGQSQGQGRGSGQSQGQGYNAEEQPRISTMSRHSKKETIIETKKLSQQYSIVQESRNSRAPSQGSVKSRASEKGKEPTSKSPVHNKASEKNKQQPNKDKEHGREHKEQTSKEHIKDREYIKYKVFNKELAKVKPPEKSRSKEHSKPKEHIKPKEKRRGSEQSRTSEKDPAKYTDSGHIMRLCRMVPKVSRANKECQTEIHMKVRPDPKDKAASERVDSFGRPLFDCMPSFEDGQWQESCTPRFYPE